MKRLKIIAAMALLFVLKPAVADIYEVSGNWILVNGDNSTDHDFIASIQQNSRTSIKDENAKQDLNPQLMFLCVPNNSAIMARIDWQRFISSFNIELGFKIDGGKFTWLKWKVDQSNKITLSPSATDTQKLVDLGLSGKRLLIEVTPYSASPITIEFDLTEFSTALEKLQASCN